MKFCSISDGKSHLTPNGDFAILTAKTTVLKKEDTVSTVVKNPDTAKAMGKNPDTAYIFKSNTSSLSGTISYPIPIAPSCSRKTEKLGSPADRYDSDSIGETDPIEKIKYDIQKQYLIRERKKDNALLDELELRWNGG